MATDELNKIVQAVMLEMEKAGVDFDFKAETPQADDLVYVMRGTADKYQGITVKWQNLLDIIVQKATDAKDEAVSAKDIALQTLATIQGIESNVSLMKSSVDASEANVASMKASVETSEANVTQMKSEVSEMKTSVEGTKTEVEGLKSDVTALKSQTQTIVDNAKEDVTGLLDTKVDKSSVLNYDDITASTPPMDLDSAVASASALKKAVSMDLLWTNASPSSSFESQTISVNYSAYKLIMIVFWRDIVSNNLCYVLSPATPQNPTATMYAWNISTILFRGIILGDNSIKFNSGVRMTTVGSDVTDNDKMIPYKIYGVR